MTDARTITEFRDIAADIAEWVHKHGIVQNGLKVTIEFATEEDAARAAFYVKSEFERDSLAPDVRSPGFPKFKAHGISFVLAAATPPGEAG